MNLASLIVRSGRLYSDRPALFVGDRQVSTYAELASHVGSLAQALRNQFGLQPGDRVALVMQNAPSFVEILFAAWHAGMVVVPVNSRLHPKELAYILDNSGARLCFASANLGDALSPFTTDLEGLDSVILVEDEEYRRLLQGPSIEVIARSPCDPAWLFYTSGTTGRPKGAELSHRNLLTMSLGYFVDFDPISPGDAILHVGPMSHGSGLYILPHVAAGAAQVIPTSSAFDADEVFSLISAHSGVSFFAAPTIVRRLTEHASAGGADTRNLKLIVYGGAPMYLEDLKRALDRFGRKFAQVYGQGESPMAITVLPKSFHANSSQNKYEERLGSVGVAQSVVNVRVVDETGATLPPGNAGEVVVRGDTVMNGYWRNPEATAETLRGGWLHTGDIGCFDDEGYLTLKDRSKDVVISGGSNIYPREIEEVILRHSAVAEVAVIGKPDRELGEVVLAVVACRPGQSVGEAELDALCLENIARFKRPKAYMFVDSLPKSSVGKVLKTELRALIGNDDIAEGPAWERRARQEGPR